MAGAIPLAVRHARADSAVVRGSLWCNVLPKGTAGERKTRQRSFLHQCRALSRIEARMMPVDAVRKTTWTASLAARNKALSTALPL